jgi:hypothetical protein
VIVSRTLCGMVRDDVVGLGVALCLGLVLHIQTCQYDDLLCYSCRLASLQKGVRSVQGRVLSIFCLCAYKASLLLYVETCSLLLFHIGGVVAVGWHLEW